MEKFCAFSGGWIGGAAAGRAFDQGSVEFHPSPEGKQKTLSDPAFFHSGCYFRIAGITDIYRGDIGIHMSRSWIHQLHSFVKSKAVTAVIQLFGDVGCREYVKILMSIRIPEHRFFYENIFGGMRMEDAFRFKRDVFNAGSFDVIIRFVALKKTFDEFSSCFHGFCVF